MVHRSVCQIILRLVSEDVTDTQNLITKLFEISSYDMMPKLIKPGVKVNEM